MAAKAPIEPKHSHGGQAIDGWPLVTGTATGPGRPIAIYAAAGLNWPAFCLIATGGMTVQIQCNPGPLDATGNPDSTQWMDYGAAIVFGGAGSNSQALSPAFPYWRTNITAYTAGALSSSVPCIPLPTGQQVSAQYPTKSTT